MTQTSKLKKIAFNCDPKAAHSIVKLLLADHKKLRSLMKKVKSHRAKDSQIISAFKELEKVVTSHVTAEENTFFKVIKDHPKFEHAVLEGYEEHRVHEYVLRGIHKVSDHDRRVQQMKIFCEVLEHHLDEEEEKVFPRFKKYAAMSTKKTMGRAFLRVRKKTNRGPKTGATRFKGSV